MPKPRLDRADRLERQYRRLATREPVCVTCGESDPFCLELHHVAGQEHHADTAIVCRNCHRKLTDLQHDHVPQAGSEPQEPWAAIGRYLLGLAELFLMVARALAEFGRQLIGRAYGSTPAR